MKRYDLVVIGGGSAGLVASLAAASIGARTALVERERLGGDCLNTGCIPSKSLLATAQLAQDMRLAGRVGLEPVEPRIDFRLVIGHLEEAIAVAGRHDSAEYLSRQGVEVVSGQARFEGPGLISVDGKELPYRAALIATGSRPAKPAVAGLEDGDYLTNETVFELSELPERLAVLGGGPTGVELAQAFHRLGSSVALVESATRILPKEEPEAGAALATQLRSEGVELHLGAAAARVEPQGDAGTLHLANGRDDTAIAYDRLLVVTGRRPTTGGLGLETVGVDVTPDGAVRVDPFLRTTGDHIFAAGDALGEPYLTHVAGHQALAAVANALFRARRRLDPTGMPLVVFTDPEIARTGLTEQAARAVLGAEPVVLRYDYDDLDRALTAGDPRGFAKLIATSRGQLVGATVVGTAAGESFSEVARLVRERRKVTDLAGGVQPYPTRAEGPAFAAREWWRIKYLTPRKVRLIRVLLAVLRAVDRPRASRQANR
jgi:pyruvate/2-oxoglutarate dehydrogenase complex dihydrolipoamide dehydrogenase (E3) component